MEISYYINLFKQKLIPLVMIIFIGSISSVFTANLLLDKQYESTTTFWITNFINSPISLTDRSIFIAPYIIKDFKELVKSQEFIAAVKSDLEEKYPRIAALDSGSMQHQIVFELNGDSRIFSLGFRDSDPAVTMAVAQTIANRFQDEVKRIFKIDGIVVIDAAASWNRTSASPKKIMIYALFFWTMLAITVLLMMDVSEKR